ncbi:MAG: pilus assembly protein N-terminal domain-containing protein [Pseudomonadota bacterium]
MKHTLTHIVSVTAALLLFLAASATGAASPDRVDIAAGESSVVKTAFPIEKVAIGDPTICGAVKTGDQELLINGKKAGQSNVFVWGPGDQKIEIQVVVKSGDIDQMAAELKEITRDIEGVRVRVVGSRVFVEGEVFTHNSMQRINRIIEGMPNVVNLVEFSPTMKEIVKGEIEKSLASQGMKNVNVTVTKNTFMLTGTVTSEEDSKRAQTMAEAYAPDIVNAIAVRKPVVKPKEELPPPPPPKAILIEMALNIMEVEKDALRDFGIHWNPGGNMGAGGSYSGATGSSPSLMGSLTGTITNLLPKMRKINESGRGRSLMQQTLITKSGDEAEFFAGSELPISVAQDGGTMSVEYKKVGVTLKFKPDLDYYQNIVSTINVESSSVTGTGPGGAPIVSNTNMHTVISVPSGSSVALGGLVGQKELAGTSSSPPGGGEALVQVNKGSRNETSSREVIIFVTPRVLDGKAPDTKEVQKKIEGDFKQQELDQLRQQAQ